MKDYKHLANKLDRQREFDMNSYEWEENRKLNLVAVACGFLITASVILACVIGWIQEAAQ
jgi:hypothetical protein